MLSTMRGKRIRYQGASENVSRYAGIFVAGFHTRRKLRHKKDTEESVPQHTVVVSGEGSYHAADATVVFLRAGSERAAELEQRLANANAHFRRKAWEVFGDDLAIAMLADIHTDKAVNLSEFEVSDRGLAFAKLAAAGFVEIGASAVCITDAGYFAFQSVEEKWNTLESPVE